jgi:hypothetical protein
MRNYDEYSALIFKKMCRAEALGHNFDGGIYPLDTSLRVNVPTSLSAANAIRQNGTPQHLDSQPPFRFAQAP